MDPRAETRRRSDSGTQTHLGFPLFPEPTSIILSALFTGAALLFLTSCIVDLIRRVVVADLSPAGYLLLACLGVVILILWILGGMAFLQILRRRKILNVIRVSKKQLVLVTP